MDFGDFAEGYGSMGLSEIPSAVSGIGSFLTAGNTQAAQGSQDVAEQQLAGQQALSSQLQGYFPALNATAAPTAGEISNLDSQLQNMTQIYQLQYASLARDTALANQINPAIGAAGTQALALLNGQNAPVLGPLQTQIANQRQQLTQQLQSQYGPGYATSSAGIQALTAFDQQSQMTLAQAQQSYTGQLLGVALSGRPNVAAETNAAGQTMSGMAQTYGGLSNQLQTRQLQNYGTQMNTLINSSTVPYQGANDVASIQEGQGQQQLMNSFLGAAMARGVLGGSSGSNGPTSGGGGMGDGGTGTGVSAFTGGGGSGYSESEIGSGTVSDYGSASSAGALGGTGSSSMASLMG